MKKIIWTKDLSVGVPKIDAEHKEFIELINKTIDLVEKKATKDEVDEVILKVYDYAKKHFSDEEKEFESWKYPLAKEHLIEHTKLLSKVKVMYDSILFNGTPPNELLNFLSYWLKDHLEKHDLKYEKYVRVHKLV